MFKFLSQLFSCISKRKKKSEKVFKLKKIKLQNFSLPNPIIVYIYKNQDSSILIFYKLLHSCKYFYFKFELLYVSQFIIEEADVTEVLVSMNSLKFLNLKLYVKKYISIEAGENHPLLFSSLLPKIYGIFESCYLQSQNLTINEYEMLTENLIKLHLYDVKIFELDGKEIFLNKILMFGSKITTFGNAPKFIDRYNYYNSETFEKIAMIQRIQKLSSFGLSYLPPALNPLAFAIFILNNLSKDAIVSLSWSSEVSREEIEKFKNVCDNHLKLTWSNVCFILDHPSLANIYLE